MEVNTKLSASETMQTQMQIDSFNKSLAVNGRTASQELGKDDFLSLLITQLANQDPLSPMENTEFIAQMAQFSSLEQMTNMSTSFSQLANMLNSSEAMGVIGKTVDVSVGDNVITGTVESATRGENPLVVINGATYSIEQVQRIYAN
ncbi:MAG: flagellar hook assembly protein FlgD [Spirochaetales bacterium]